LLSEIRPKPLEQERQEREKEWKDEIKKFDREHKTRIKAKEAEFKRKFNRAKHYRLDGCAHKVLSDLERDKIARNVEE
jgi:hypothetical protein